MRIWLPVVVAALALASGATGAAGGPRLWPTQLSPVGLAGSGFTPHQRVTVSVLSGTTAHAKTIRSSAAGRFAVVFPTIDVPQNCHGSGIVATAKTASGIRISVKIGGGSSRDCAPKQPLNR